MSADVVAEPADVPAVEPLDTGVIGIPDAPNDGKMYARENAAWDLCVPVAGGTMTGRLVLAGSVPNDPQAAVTKSYVDASSQNIDGGTY
jgi:hypothetical protein